jgi:BirA family biotin operon repressor/biotin-[acetyl-CoA-carboxylase] ligase
MSNGNSLVEDYHLLSYQEVDSTNEEAKRLAVGGASHGAFIWAKKQTHGRGRAAREWVSREGNLFVSVLLSPDIDLKHYQEVSFVAALAVKEMLQPIVGSNYEISLKWPNDVLLNGKKVAGVLLETVLIAKKNWLIVGVGLNVDSHPKDVRYPATCLTEAGVQIISAKIALSRFIHHFVGRYDMWMKEGFSPVRAAWCEAGFRFGKSVTMEAGDEVINGVFADISPEGFMIVKTAKGDMRIIQAGEMSQVMEKG